MGSQWSGRTREAERVAGQAWDELVSAFESGGDAARTVARRTADIADELQLVVAPFFVGDSRARRFVSDGCFPYHAQRRAELAETKQIGDVVLLRYALSERFRAEQAIA